MLRGSARGKSRRIVSQGPLSALEILCLALANARVTAGSPSLARPASPQGSHSAFSGTTTYTAKNRTTSHSNLGLEQRLSHIDVRNFVQLPRFHLRLESSFSSSPSTVKLRMVCSRSRTTHEPGRTVLTPRRAHRICDHGISSCTHLRDHCCHEKGCQKKSLWFARSSIHSLLLLLTPACHIDSDSDSSIEQLTNRGNKLRKKARYIHEGQLAAPSGPQVYKRVSRVDCGSSHGTR
jgi:RXT2-like, N-terminal